MRTNRALWRIGTVVWIGAFLFATAVQARGVGIQAGAGRIHASMDLDTTFDSNPNFDIPANEKSDMLLRIRPGLAIQFPSSSFEFELGAKVGYDYYMGLEEKKTSDYSAIAGEADMVASINPEGQVTFNIEDTFVRASDPINSESGLKLQRTDNEARGKLALKPGGGALSVDLGYGYAINYYDDISEGGTRVYDGKANSSYAHRAYFGSTWRFLPKTAVVLDVNGELRRYIEDATGNVGMNAIRATLGLNGYVTSTISVKLAGGFGDTMMQESGGDDFKSFIGKAELAYNAKTTYVQGGYNRSFRATPGYGYFGQDRLFAWLRQTIAGKLSLFGEVGFDWLAFGRGQDNTMPERKDTLLSAKVAIDYSVNDWFDFGVGYNILLRSSETEGIAQSTDYTKHMATFHLGVNY